MTNTIEVPISLIKAGDLDAIRELLPKENLFGRWAEHSDYGRGIIVSEHPDTVGALWFSLEKGENGRGTVSSVVDLKDLTLDPVELVTVEDFENAPEGTVVADSRGDAYQKTDTDDWKSHDCRANNKIMATLSPWKILRYGWGE
ncbi:hypothetical protein ACL1CN_10365 [Corynebacterium striatum]|nr:hypothetical protein [Corynebacterium striatum]HCG2985197.1 hypothetical protein [Corynebacterium striatum]HCG3001019.1 hypothetical protein [Corynebacterium striatum]HCG3016910.1 hypothetical protein [Corynebacterium striatum]HCG3143541.1 hypothetical protein [Corynebacterium striatum]